MPLVQLPQRVQRLDPLLPGLADADQDPARERDACLSREPDRFEPRGGQLVGRGPVRHPPLREPVGCRLEHDPHRDRDLAQRGKILRRQHTGIEVREQAGLVENGLGRPRQVLERRLAAQLGKLLPGDPVAQLRLVAEREERLVAAGRRARPRDRQHLVDRHEGALAAPRRPGERAVVADVPAELRQRDEHLRRVGDERPVALGAHSARLHAELSERRVEQLGSSGH